MFSEGKRDSPTPQLWMVSPWVVSLWRLTAIHGYGFDKTQGTADFSSFLDYLVTGILQFSNSRRTCDHEFNTPDAISCSGAPWTISVASEKAASGQILCLACEHACVVTCLGTIQRRLALCKAWNLTPFAAPDTAQIKTCSAFVGSNQQISATCNTQS